MKYLIIDSIARSGTTLFSSLVRSQKKCVTFDGNFMEPWNIHGNPSVPLNNGYKPIEFKANSNPKYQSYPNEIMKVFSSRHAGERIMMGKSFSEWKKILNTEIVDYDSLYNRIAKEFNSDLIGFRWNQNLFYAPQWLNRSNQHYWAVVIRNPLDRTASNLKTHGWKFNDCVKLSQELDRKFWILKEKYPDRLILVHYEDLINDPQGQMKTFFSKIDFEVNQIDTENLIGANNQPYRNQGWRVKREKGDHRKGTKFQNFYKTSVNQYENLLTHNQIATIKEKLSDLRLFSRYFG